MSECATFITFLCSVSLRDSSPELVISETGVRVGVASGSTRYHICVQFC